MNKKILISALCLLLGAPLWAQTTSVKNTPSNANNSTVQQEEEDLPFIPYQGRKDDRFWTRKVVNRIDLREKMNKPLINKESQFYQGEEDQQFSERDGLIMTLVNGLKNGEFKAYHPDSLKKDMSFEDIVNRMVYFEGKIDSEEGLDSPSEGWGDEDEEGSDFNDINGDDTSGDDGWGDDTGGDDGWGDDGFDDLDGNKEEGDLFGSEDATEEFDNFASLETIVEFVEDRIFDKVRSDMVYNIQYIRLIWVDAGGMLPEEPLCIFRYEEVVNHLDKAQWKNRFNDAEMRTMRQALDMRLFNSFIIDVSGTTMLNKDEAEIHRQKMIEFEHHLWSF